MTQADEQPTNGGKVSSNDQQASAAGAKATPSGGSRRWIGLVVGPVVFLAALFLLPDSLPVEGRATAAIALLMAIWWMTEAIPIPATALLPLVLFPILNVAPLADVAPPYANDIIFLFMGGFMLALAMQRWNLHKRIALRTVLVVGTSPKMLIAGFMIATGFVSMWVSNTATAVMMLPIGLSVLVLTKQLGDGKGDPNFGTALMLGIAYAASIGSLGTIIGTPPNTLLVGYLADNHDISIGFGQWMLFGVPIAVVFLFLAWLVLTRFIYPPKLRELPGGRELIQQQLDELGPLSRGEKLTLGVFVFAALSWIGVPLLADVESVAATLPWLANISDGVIAMVVAILLFLLPVEPRTGTNVLDWETAKELPWGILLLFGGGLSLSGQFTATGLSTWIGERVTALGVLPLILLIALVAVLVLFLTELTSNTATAATFLPILGGVAIGLGLDPMVLAIPVALAATSAFMLPVATPPNAIAYGSGYVAIGQMVRAGIWLNIIAVVLITAAMYGLGGLVFSLTL
ncbi:anion transporter [Actinoalloteichus sp. GBA129-24]|nr:DASS family sodium-coupled anion symporter [Actinoalloteichus sp. GBA129-24]APU23989.1 anion transporter [Actinoalloteichus sp. GBA129-24]